MPLGAHSTFGPLCCVLRWGILMLYFDVCLVVWFGVPFACVLGF